MKPWVLLLTLTILLSACSGDIEEKSLETASVLIANEVESIKEQDLFTTNTITEIPALIPNSIHLKFEEFELIIDSLEVWNEEEKLKAVLTDSAIVYLELGESIEGRKVRIKRLKQGSIKVFQRFENSVTIMNEGPHCDLTEWKHYDSEWAQLPLHDGQFVTASYSEEDWEKFIEVDMNELRSEVRKYCGDFWAEHIKDAKSPTDYPCGVSTSRIFLKIEFQDPNSNKLLEKIVSFEIPMGC